MLGLEDTLMLSMCCSLCNEILAGLSVKSLEFPGGGVDVTALHGLFEWVLEAFFLASCIWFASG